MRKYLIFLIALFTMIFVSCSKQQERPGTVSSKSTPLSTYSIENVDFLTPKIGYLTLYKPNNNIDDYTIIKTTDGGENWAIVSQNVNMHSSFFINENVGYGLAINTTDGFTKISKTSNGGLNWSDTGFFKNRHIGRIKAVNSDVMFANMASQNADARKGDYGSILAQLYRTIDGGKTWAEIKLPESNDELLSDYSFLSAQQGYVLYGGGVGAGQQGKTLYYTDNGGKTWDIKSKAPGFDDESAAIGNIGIGGTNGRISCFSDGVVYIYYSNPGKIVKSTDAGVHFTDVHTMEFEPYFIDSNEGYAVQDNFLVHTANGGKDFSKVISAYDIISKIQSKSGTGKLMFNKKYMQETVQINPNESDAYVLKASEYGYKSQNDIPYLLFKEDGTGEFNVNYLDGVVCQPMKYTIFGDVITVTFDQYNIIDFKITNKTSLKCMNINQSKTGLTRKDDIFSAG